MKFEFVAFSDFHAHNFKYGSSTVQHPHLKGAYNSRLLYAERVLDELTYYCVSNDIQTVLFGGDLFHTHGKVDVDVLNITSGALKRLAAETRIFMIPGNHDHADKHGYVHSLETLSKNYGAKSIQDTKHITVAGTALTIPLHLDVMLHCCPYRDNRLELIDDLSHLAKLANEQPPGHLSILLAHAGMQGARVGSDYVMLKDSDLEVGDVDFGAFDICLFGHFHEHQRIFNNGWYIGATYQHNWGDVNGLRGWVHCTLEKGKPPIVRHIESTTAPKFYVLDSKSRHTVTITPKDFVRYLADTEEAVPTDITSTTLEVIHKPKGDVELPTLDATTLSPLSLIDSWVDSTADGDDELKKLGKELLREAEKGSL